MSENSKITLLGVSSRLLGWAWFAASVGVFCLAGMALWGRASWSLVGWCFGLAFTANLLARLFEGMKERLTLQS